MDPIVLFLFLLVVAGAAAGAQLVIGGWPAEGRGRFWAAFFVAYALLLTLPVFLPKLLGG